MSLVLPRTAGQRTGRFNGFRVVALVVAGAVTLLAIYPLIRMAVRLLADDPLTAVSDALAEPGIGKVVLNTVIVVTTSTLLALVLGAVLAWLTERTDARIGSITGLLPIFPLLVPPIAGAVGWVLLASPSAGYLNNYLRDLLGFIGIERDAGPLDIFSWAGLIFVYTVYLVPHVFLTVSAGLRNIDPALEEASRINGASAWTTLRRVTMPAIKPALATGATLASLMAVAMFSVPAILGISAHIEVLPVRIIRVMTFSFPPKIDAAVVLALISLSMVAVVWAIQARILRSNRFATIGGKGSRHSVVKLGPLRWVARAFIVFYVSVATVLPAVALVAVSLQPFWTADIQWDKLRLDAYENALVNSPVLRNALQNSFGAGIIGASLGILIAAIVAYFVRSRQNPFMGGVVDVSLRVPGALSHVVVAIAFVASFVGPPFNLAGTLTILFIAYVVLYMPQATFSASAALGQIGGELFEASSVAGASSGRTFRWVALPLMRPGLIAGWVLMFVLIAGDITASVMLSGSQNPVVGFVILDLWNAGSLSSLAAVATIVSVASSFVVLATLRYTSDVLKRR